MSDDLKSCPFCGSDDLGSGGDDKVVGYWCNSCQAAGPNHYGRYEWNSRADRIEELEAENRLLRDAVYIDDRTVTMQANDRSKAMTAIRRALDFLNADMPTEAKTALRTTLAELTGGKDD